MTWSGMIPVDDTALYTRDTGGPGRPVVYLNGAYADQSHWRRVIAELGDGYRHITYDERARGRSRRSADYSFEGCLRDLDAVLTARGVDRPLLVGWSFGGVVAWHWADRFPERTLGVVCVDAFPVGVTGEEGRARIRRLFRRARFALPITSLIGMGARMSADQHADVNIELNEIAAASVPVLERLTRPVRFVLATGDSMGSGGGEMDAGRATLEPLLARNPLLTVGARVPSNHTGVLRRDSPAVARTVRELAAS
ncbi:alpha/beta fold hydrolase [Catenuloplanes atrovinosus]|uniref:Pimeloyl-ACP methyl ester carboxylesterase n=1 Tax=Catenuloplanes atrovinosus TaxID=137266 RepID=A0AAE3YQE7_9ACTN|nr:alpha/beta hydrolase [Catenuloplanes atrovinosus]MDR7276429.1 pimeloyl-ACP methyl ester carboxylesterase [Catenuloplanes atrovinosus]